MPAAVMKSISGSGSPSWKIARPQMRTALGSEEAAGEYSGRFLEYLRDPNTLTHSCLFTVPQPSPAGNSTGQRTAVGAAIVAPRADSRAFRGALISRSLRSKITCNLGTAHDSAVLPSPPDGFLVTRNILRISFQAADPGVLGLW